MTIAKVPFDSKIKQHFLRKLSFLLPPFDHFVAKGDLPEKEPVFPSRDGDLTQISKITEKNQSMIIPVISNVGSGKTHFLWGIHGNLPKDTKSVFLSLPRSKEKFLYHIYSNFIKIFGQPISDLRDFSQNFGEKFGAAERVYGLFRTRDTQKVVEAAIEQLSGDYEDADSLYQCVKVIVQHLMSFDKSQTAERWLLGQLMDESDLKFLNVDDDLSNESMAKTMLKLILEHFPNDIVFLFDDLDKAASEFNSLEEYFDPADDVNWAGDLAESSEDAEDPGDFALLNELLTLMKDIKNLKIVVTLDREESEKYLKWFAQHDADNQIADLIKLDSITLQETYYLFFSRMNNFCIKNNVPHPTADPDFDPKSNIEEYMEHYGEDLYFPLNQEILQVIYGITFGNPRLILKNFKRIFDAIIYEELSIDDVKTDYKRFLKVDELKTEYGRFLEEKMI